MKSYKQIIKELPISADFVGAAIGTMVAGVFRTV